MTQYQVLLFYKYVTIEDPDKLKIDILRLCEHLNLRGRVIVAGEGINGTLEGTLEDTEMFATEIAQDARFADMQIKRSGGTGEAFPRLKVRVRPEIVIEVLGGCTRCDAALFHSFRRDGEAAGRMISFIEAAT